MPAANAGDFAESGQWGDSFGALNALFSGLAFTGALAALFLQGQAMERQNKDLHRQRFESSYFELLSLLREARREVRFRHSSTFIRARSKPSAGVGAMQKEADAFRTAMLEMRYLIRSFSKSSLPNESQTEHIYRTFIHNRFESTFGPYFRIVYTILKRIKSDKILTYIEKIQYSNLLRGQLTTHEVNLAAFNGLMPESNDFRSLLTDFHMLKYTPYSISRRVLENIYDASAFAARND